jgi:hypothetical protein
VGTQSLPETPFGGIFAFFRKNRDKSILDNETTHDPERVKQE